MAVAIIGPKFYAWDRNGKPLAFGKVFTYQARTNTPKPTYQSEDGLVENTNPVILNGEGYADIYLDGSYKIVVKDSDDNEIWTADPVTAAQATEWVNCLPATYLSPTSFKVNGNFTAVYEPGRRVRIDNGTTEFAYSTIQTSSFAGGETTIVVSDPVVATGIASVCVSVTGRESLPKTEYPTLDNLKADVSILAGDLVNTVGYYDAGDGGAASYLIKTSADFGGVPDGYGDHQLDNGLIAVLQHGPQLQALQYGVNPSQMAVADALKACTDAAAVKNCEVMLPNGAIKVEKTVQVIPGVSVRGAGRGRSTVEADGNYTVFEITTNFRAMEFSVSQTSGNNEGIAFGNKRTDGSDNQAVYNFFDRVSVVGFDFSWWYRCSIWCSWKDCYSRSLVGIRFARNADPYDVTSDAPASWNIFSPTLGWFHNVGTIHNMNFEDVECGIYGCCMGYHISGCTTQRQSGDKADNKILPVTEERTGIWLESGNTGTRNAWNNIIEAHYAESCRRPFYIQDQRACSINSSFVQGGPSSARYLTPVDANNSTVYLEGMTGQDWFDWKVIAKNNATIFGDTAGATTGTANDVQDTSNWFRYREQEPFTHKYNFGTSNASDSFTLPVTLQEDSHYELYVGGLYDGFSLRHATYDVFRWNSDSLTSVNLRSGAEVNFNITVVGGKLVVNKTGSQPLIFEVTLREVTPSTFRKQPLTAD